MMRVLFADDHDLLRDTFKAFLEAEGLFAVELAANVADALALIAENGPYDLVLLDFQIPGMNGLLGLRQIIAAQGERPVLLLTGVATAGTATAALRFGAAAVLSKTLSIDKVKHAMLSIANGHVIPANPQTVQSDGLPDTPTLTPRQEEVLRCICDGLANKQIARSLNLREATVKMHIKMIFAKLGVNSRTQAIIASKNFNLI